MRDHEPVLIEEFNGLWRRGDPETCPLDHFIDTDNCISLPGGFETRPGLDDFQVGDDPQSTIRNIVRMYTFVHNNIEGLLVLDSAGNIYHTTSVTPLTPILTIPAMTDFAFVQVANRAYISPHNGVTGLEDDFLYVYLGDGAPARKAAGFGPTGPQLTATDAGVGHIEFGVHLLAVAYETDTGFVTKLGENTIVAYSAPSSNNKCNLSNIAISPDTFVVARHILGTKAINPTQYAIDSNPQNYEFFFVPDGRIPDNTTTTLDVSFFDSELLDSADFLFDLFEEVPAFVNLTTYHERMVGVGEFGDPTNKDELANPSTVRVSQQGEPEAFNQVDGLIVVPLDGNPLTNASEFRDVLYVMKSSRTFSINDNGDVPSTWKPIVLDQGIGASVHGIAQVLDSGGVSVDYLLIIGFPGLYLFNGAYIKPELSWKIDTLWNGITHSEFNKFQILNDTIDQRLYIAMPNATLMVVDYNVALDAEKVKWWPWRFPNQVTTIALIQFNKLVIGSRRMMET